MTNTYRHPARVGVFGAGLAAYWPQFDGLLERLLEHQAHFESRLAGLGAEIVSAGMVDSAASARAAGDMFRREGIDLLVCFMSTYATSSAVLPVAQRAGAPMIIASLQPSQAMVYARGTTWMQLEHDNQTSLPEVCNALERANIHMPGMVVGCLYDDDRAWAEIEGWCRVADALAAVSDARIGLMGHPYEGMLDMNSDPTMFDGRFGLHVEHLELDDLHACVDAVTERETELKLATIRRTFDFPEPGADPIAGPADPEDLRWAAQVACGLDRLADRFDLTALAYYYRGLAGNANERLGASLSVGSSLLTARGFPVAGEYDLKTCLAMLVVDRLGAGGSFAEIHPCDFRSDIVLMGHDGPHHMAVAEGKPVLRGLKLYHGKRGAGVGVEFQLKTGPITCVGLTQTGDGRFRFVVAEGRSLAGPIPQTGNTNTRCRFPPDLRSFIANWSLAAPTHHFALGVGHVGWQIEALARCWGIEYVNVTEEGYRRAQRLW